jgi:hypothetical protein
LWCRQHEYNNGFGQEGRRMEEERGKRRKNIDRKQETKKII